MKYTVWFELQEPDYLKIVSVGSCGHKHRSYSRAVECEASLKTAHLSAHSDCLIQTTWIEGRP